MSRVDVELRPFVPGTVGWTASDLDDPAIEDQWLLGRYEIVEGVLTTMPPAYFAGSGSLFRLTRLLADYFDRAGIDGEMGHEVDIVLGEDRLAVADAVFMTTSDRESQRQAAALAGKPDDVKTRLLVPPTLVIESVSPGHERHDRKTKRSWYAEFGVPNYWIFDAFARSIQCLRLADGHYVEDVSGTDTQRVNPTAFPGLAISLAGIWSRS